MQYTNYIIFIPVVLAVAYAAYLMLWLKRQPKGSEKMQEISKAIRIGARAYLNRQYRTVAIVAIVLFVIIWLVFQNWVLGIGFLLGGILSALAGYIGLNVSVTSNSKTTQAAHTGLGEAMSVAFRAGSVTGFLVVALGLLGVAGFYLLTGQDATALIGFGFGASLISVFARLGGGIFTKAADVGTDLVGKVEAGIPEDDPRNPGVIADNVGDNVGDCAGMAADLFETYAVTLTAALLLGAALLTGQQVFFPLVIGGLAIVASVVGTLFVRLGKKKGIMHALYKGLGASVIVSAGLFYLAAQQFFPENLWSMYISTLIGLAVTVLMVLVTDYYTAKKYRPVQSISKASESGHGTNIIMGLSVGMESTFLPILIIAAGIISSYILANVYGVALAATAMLSVAGIIVAIDSFGPVTDNAGGIAEMSDAPEEVRKVTDSLDAVGNTTKAVTKGYAIASAGLAALALFAGFTQEVATRFELPDFSALRGFFDITNPFVLVGLLIGASIPYLFSSIAMKSVGKAAGAIVDEIRRQFREIKGIMDGTQKPDYGKAVDIVTKAALKEMIIPALLPVFFILVVGLGTKLVADLAITNPYVGASFTPGTVIAAQALGGLLIGVILSGLFVAISMTSGGAAWDNGKKYIEDGNFGGKGSDAHKAAVTGDTVGDPYKDTAGPAINPLIKVIMILALLIVPLL
ncbi:sodium-translocating pyrophosphatase [Candidatus Wolfebacteria bacterium RIFCSPHIGHO2_01_FULL_48_22]|uniref:K(+)-insensitive pyrophosphate-energized proton pump n=2 Tax=Candidatus Wolfeibacteriota TaxID=1752735 RepID=A0A1F8DNZ2_9BACT|nr:MAG: sodium-translocating pyrophosphatase [Candidatus Wolfebacteria bacterium RIFCSPHIGHO2_01_FULL_48_22]OGM93513.1 MAG: sodium-translocating pyrophosphatase [Candidatus Wolfebacteria bacterium RIFCSPLOWO2_01_FULL_47_17b]